MWTTSNMQADDKKANGAWSAVGVNLRASKRNGKGRAESGVWWKYVTINELDVRHFAFALHVLTSEKNLLFIRQSPVVHHARQSRRSNA